MQGSRVFVSMAVAIAVTLSLFLLMQFLISGRTDLANRGDNLGSIRFGPVDIDEDLNVRERRIPRKPPPPKDPPPPPKMNVASVEKPMTQMPDLNMPKLDLAVSGSGPFLGNIGNVDKNAEGDIIPLVRIQPQYPRRAAIAKIEGWVEMEFTITETGAVANPKVINAQPPRIFDREALRALLKWKFKPRVVDGKPVPRQATQRIDFNLAGA